MRTSPTRKVILTGAAALGVMFGAAGITAAATNSGASSPASAQAEQDQKPSYTSSITAPENAKLDGLAKITADQASSSATTATGGKAGKVELENESGNVVFGVEVTQADGTMLDVKVDAGNGNILTKESDDNRGTDAGDGTKDTESTDSAEVPDGAGQPQAGN